MTEQEYQNIKVGDKFKYNSTSDDVDSFDFFVFMITPKYLEIIINRVTAPIYRKIAKTEMLLDNVTKS